MLSRSFVHVAALAVALTPIAAASQELATGSACASTRFVARQALTGMVVAEETLFPGLVPPGPAPVSPITTEAAGEMMVVEGNLGKFIRPGTMKRSTADWEPAAFQWQPVLPHLFNIPISGGIKGTIRFSLGHTTHYHLCLYQPEGGLEARCDDPTTWAAQASKKPPTGIRLFWASCSASSLIPDFGNGVAQYADHTGNIRQQGFVPEYPTAGYPQVLDLDWKPRACNGDHCNSWSAANRLAWVPPPPISRERTDTDASPWQLQFA